ncbi:MAG: methylisocitrate lyase [Gracilibacteraceae bacterium]|jgi:methylisocitrate lyase|nr:methylisocitrate lyase [Gracilibacteraceae bacterium]
MIAKKSFRALLQEKKFLSVPGTFNALVARMIEDHGFDAVYCTGGGLCTSLLGMPDIGLVTLTEFAQMVGHISSAVEIPVISDADTGFGNAINVIRAVQEFEKAGVSGIHIEDQVMAKRCGHVAGKEVIAAGEMAGKIRAACFARRNPEFSVIARTDARAVEGMEGAVARALLYKEAGADIIFPEALQTAEELVAFRQAVPDIPLIANMTEYGKTPYFTATEWHKMGYQIVIFPVTTMRIAMKAVDDFLGDLKATGTQKNWLDRMQTRAELYKAVHYERYTDWENEYLPAGGVAPIQE